MPEDADQDIRSRALCACGRQRGPSELSSHATVEELSWGLGWQYSFWQSFRRLFSVQVKELSWASCEPQKAGVELQTLGLEKF